MASSPELLSLRGVRKAFAKADGSEHVVLDGVDLGLRSGEMVALLGRSGSGKSTLLRIIAGLIAPSGGSAEYQGRPIAGPVAGIAMVFQGAAVFPWLSALENVQLGLDALGVGREESRRRALAAIDMIGLDGFESALPRELSGGMRQRIGFARAVVVHPDLLLMDEPFSALDVLTAETLKTDFLELWAEGQLPIQAALIVTHNIEEAVFMCDRICVFSINPGRIVREIRVDLPRPRDRQSPAFRDLVETLYAIMTARPEPRPGARSETSAASSIGIVLPRVSTNLLSGLMETVAAPPWRGQADLPVISQDLHMTADQLLPVAETLQTLRFADLAGGDIHLLPAGFTFAEADLDTRKALFARHLLNHVALAAHVRRVLDERPSHSAPWERFVDELEDHMPTAAAEQTLRAVVSWGRYGEVFAYDDEQRRFSLDNPG